MTLAYGEGSKFRERPLQELIEVAAQSEGRNSPKVEVAIGHDDRFIMLLLTYGEDVQLVGGQPMKLCHHLQDFQVEENDILGFLLLSMQIVK